MVVTHMTMVTWSLQMWRWSRGHNKCDYGNVVTPNVTMVTWSLHIWRWSRGHYRCDDGHVVTTHMTMVTWSLQMWRWSRSHNKCDYGNVVTTDLTMVTWSPHKVWWRWSRGHYKRWRWSRGHYRCDYSPWSLHIWRCKTMAGVNGLNNHVWITHAANGVCRTILTHAQSSNAGLSNIGSTDINKPAVCSRHFSLEKFWKVGCICLMTLLPDPH